jgi:hypothetical protein
VSLSFGGGAIVVGVEDRSGRLLGAALDAEWFRHRVYEHVGVAPGVKERHERALRQHIPLVERPALALAGFGRLITRFGALFRDAGDDEFAGLEAAFCGRRRQFVTQ